MADKETDFKITIGAEADEQSAERATKKIKKAVDSSVKGGRIEVPVDISVNIDKDKDKLVKAQAAVVKKLEKMTAKGFSASGKDIDDLVGKFETLTKELDKAGKGRQNKIFREIRRQVEEIQSVYKSSKDITKPTKTKSTGNKKRASGPVDKNSDSGINNEQIKKETIKEYKRQLRKIRSDKNYGLDKVVPKGYNRTIEYDDKLLQESDRQGPYRSNWARQMRMSEIAAVKWMKDSLKVSKDKDKANQFAENAISGKKHRDLTDKEKASEKANVASNELAKILGGLEHARLDTTLDQFNTYLDGVMKFSGDAGKDTFDGIMLALNKTFNRYFSNSGALGITDGTPKGEDKGHAQAKIAIAQMIKKFKDALDKDGIKEIKVASDKIVTVSSEQLRQLKQLAKIDQKATEKEIDRIMGKTSGNPAKKTKSTIESNSTLNRELTQSNKLAERQNLLAARSINREDVADANANKEAKEANSIAADIENVEQVDANDGFNDENTAKQLLDSVSRLNSTLENVAGIIKNIFGSVSKKTDDTPEVKNTNLPSPYVQNEKGYLEKTSVQDKSEPLDGKRKIVLPTQKQYDNAYAKAKERPINDPDVVKAIEEDLAKFDTGEHESQQRTFLDKSEVNTFQKGFIGIIQKAMKPLLPQSEADRIMSMNLAEQERMRAERMNTFGENRGRNLRDTGDMAALARVREVWNTLRGGGKITDPLKDVKLTKGFNGENAIDTTKIMAGLNKVLSGPEMFKAQTGGAFRNLVGSMTGYIGMPSLEKSRAQAEGLNQVMANVRNEVLGLIQDVQAKESTLTGMMNNGTARFDKEGMITEDSSSMAKKTFHDLEEQKGVLKAALAEVAMIDQIVGKCGGKVSKIVKQIGFVMPELMQNNTILQNINAGLDKNGKALKFQTRTAEILSYTFQLMARSIGQMWKNLMSMLNPVNALKKLFNDFMGYNVKWQRTMNVIKYNLRAISEKLMDSIAQKLVNIIGFFDIILQRIQKAFGHTPISLFDQSAADAEKIKEELEAAANVTAGFDELHDIGSDNSGANDLLGDIYKPQLSQEWIDLANKIGDLFEGIIKGDMGFGEVLKTIFSLLLEALGLIAKTIWDWFKETAIGKYIINHWKDILATLLTLFIGWQLLKIAGKLLWNALFEKFTSGAISGLFSKLGGWISSGLSTLAGKGGILGFVGSFGQGIMMAFQTLFTGGKYSLLGTLKEMFTSSAAITEAGSWGSMLGFAITKALGAALAGAAVMKGFDMVADDASYNIGLEEGGGKDKDKKSGLGGKVLGAVGGAALAGLVVGGPIAMGIGAIAGLIVTSLAPAFEELAVKAKDANNEMQKIEYYEGKVKGAQSSVDELDEMLGVMNKTLEAQTSNVYKTGEELGISKTRMDELVKSVQNGTYNVDMLSGKELGLKDSLEQLSFYQDQNKTATDKLTEAKKKLEKAELDLAIANDIEAGNFEMASARIEYAMATGLYETDEAAKKMAQIMKETSFTEAQELLSNCSPELQKKWNEYTSDIDQGKKDLETIFKKMSKDERDELLKSNNEDLKRKWIEYSTTTEQGKKDLKRMYSEMNEEERKAFSKDYSGEAGSAMSKAINAMQKEINNTTWDWSHPFKSLMSTFTGNWSWKGNYASFDVGTNYVPNDGFAYIHKGEAIIPADENVFAKQGSAWSSQMASNDRMLQAIEQLDATIKQGIDVKGQFVQRGSDLIATVEKANNRMKNNVLNNKVYAR